MAVEVDAVKTPTTPVRNTRVHSTPATPPQAHANTTLPPPPTVKRAIAQGAFQPRPPPVQPRGTVKLTLTPVANTAARNTTRAPTARTANIPAPSRAMKLDITSSKDWAKIKFGTERPPWRP